MDNYTRWNSWFKMLQVLLLLKAYVKEYCVEFKNKLYKDLLDFNDQKKLCTIIEFLNIFKASTLNCEGDVSLDKTLFIIDVLIKHINDTIIQLSPCLLLLS